MGKQIDNMPMMTAVRKLCHTGRYRAVAALIGDNGGKLLDIGCGKPFETMPDGAFLDYIGNGVGVDVNPCATHHPFVRSSVLALPFKKGSFSVVVAMEVLEHVEDIRLALRNISQVIKDDGIFIMSTPSNSLICRVCWPVWVRTWGRMWAGTHKTKLTAGEWAKIIEKEFIITERVHRWGINVIFKARKRPMNG